MSVSGSRCDVCSDNYYGNPEVPGGRCQPCECSNNIDLLKPGNCDPHTGVCKQCLYHTTGDSCEVCEPGYFRLSDNAQCEGWFFQMGLYTFFKEIKQFWVKAIACSGTKIVA